MTDAASHRNGSEDRPIAYLILAHEQPELVHRLIEALQTERSRFFVHIDRKSDRSAFASIERLTHVTILPATQSVKVYWAGWSIVEATLRLIRTARASEDRFAAYVLLSGTHHPIRSSHRIEAVATHGRACITLRPVPLPHKPMSRFDRIHLEGAYRTSLPRRLITRLANRVLAFAGQRDPNRILGDMKLFAGCQFWVLPEAAIEWIETEIAKSPEIVRFFHHVRMPEESFFQTLIGNSPFLEGATGTATFVDWSHPTEKPCFIEERHLPLLLSEDFKTLKHGGPPLFARKFGKRNLDLLGPIAEFRHRHANPWQAALGNNVPLREGIPLQALRITSQS